MKTRIISVLLAVIMLFGITSASAAYVPTPEINPQASLQLSAYSITLEALGDGEMYIDFTVDGTTVMDKIGIFSLVIEERTPGGAWDDFDILYGYTHPEFYMYNSVGYLGEYYFDGTVGNDYRATIVVYAEDSRGCDTGELTSVIARCT